MDVKILGDLLDGLNALERLKRHAGFEFGVVSSSFYFHFVWFRLDQSPASDHQNHSLAPGPNFGVRLSQLIALQGKHQRIKLRRVEAWVEVAQHAGIAEILWDSIRANESNWIAQ